MLDQQMPLFDRLREGDDMAELPDAISEENERW